MTLPDVDVQIAEAPAQRFAPLSPANWMPAGLAPRGPVGTPVLVASLAEYVSYFGPYESDSSTLYNALDVFFRERGKYAYVSRIAGPDYATSSGEIDDSDSPTINVSASSPGEWGDLIEVIIDAQSGGFTVTIEYDGTVVEESGLLETVAEAVLWSASSAYVRFTAVEAGGEPIDQTVALTGGDDDRDNVTITEREAALAAFTRDLGPGQVSVPGDTSSATQEAVLEHCYSHKRIARLDALDNASAATVAAAATNLRTTDGHTLAGLFWPWETAPGIVAGTERTVPPCARNAALLARILASGGTVGDPTAGERWPALYVTGLTQNALSDADRETLNDAGVNVSRVMRGEIVTYGNRTLTSELTEPNWSQLSQSTVIAAIAARGEEIGGQYVHSKVDGKGVKLGDFAGELEGMMLREFYTPGDVYGDSPADAFTVIPSADIDGPSATLLATIAARVSPGADRVEIPIYKQPIA